MSKPTERVTVGHNVRVSDDPQFFWCDKEFGEIRVSFGPECWGAHWDVSSTTEKFPPTSSMLAILALVGEAEDYFLYVEREGSFLPSPHGIYRSSIEGLRDNLLEHVSVHSAEEWREGLAYVMARAPAAGKGYVLSVMSDIIRRAKVTA